MDYFEFIRNKQYAYYDLFQPYLDQLYNEEKDYEELRSKTDDFFAFLKENKLNEVSFIKEALKDVIMFPENIKSGASATWIQENPDVFSSEIVAGDICEHFFDQTSQKKDRLDNGEFLLLQTLLDNAITNNQTKQFMKTLFSFDSVNEDVWSYVTHQVDCKKEIEYESVIKTAHRYPLVFKYLANDIFSEMLKDKEELIEWINDSQFAFDFARENSNKKHKNSIFSLLNEIRINKDNIRADIKHEISSIILNDLKDIDLFKSVYFFPQIISYISPKAYAEFVLSVSNQPQKLDLMVSKIFTADLSLQKINKRKLREGVPKGALNYVNAYNYKYVDGYVEDSSATMSNSDVDEMLSLIREIGCVFREKVVEEIGLIDATINDSDPVECIINKHDNSSVVSTVAPIMNKLITSINPEDPSYFKEKLNNLYKEGGLEYYFDNILRNSLRYGRYNDSNAAPIAYNQGQALRFIEYLSSEVQDKNITNIIEYSKRSIFKVIGDDFDNSEEKTRILKDIKSFSLFLCKSSQLNDGVRTDVLDGVFQDNKLEDLSVLKLRTSNAALTKSISDYLLSDYTFLEIALYKQNINELNNIKIKNKRFLTALLGGSVDSAIHVAEKIIHMNDSDFDSYIKNNESLKRSLNKYLASKVDGSAPVVKEKIEETIAQLNFSMLERLNKKDDVQIFSRPVPKKI